MKKMDLNVLEPLLSLDSDPQGNNLNKSYTAFYQKKIYEVKSFNSSLIPDNKPLNILYDKQFYGRVNLNNQPIILKNNSLRSLTDVGGNEIKLNNFVFDAYRDFSSYWDSLKKVNKLNTNSQLYNIKIQSSWISPARMYFYYMSQVLEQIKQQIKNKQINIKNFNDFLNEFVDYVEGSTPFIPITFSSFVISRMADPFISGLCFDVKTLDLTDDSVKYSQILQDPNYAIFMKSAIKYGFIPDKHVPWRLYADIDSIAMKPYLDKYLLTQDNLYETNYVLADLYDLELLRFYLIQFYNTYVTGKPSYSDNKFKICERTGTTIVERKEIKLDKLNLDDIKTDINYDRLLMKLYVFLKVRENNYGWDEQKFNNAVQTFTQIKEALDTESAMKYIRQLFVKPAIYDRKQRNFLFT